MSECLFSLEVKLLAGLNEKLPEKYRKNTFLYVAMADI